MQRVIELTEEFYRSSVIVETPIDTSMAVIPAPRGIDQIIADEVKFFSSTMTAQLRVELRADIDRAKAELDAMQAERASIARQCTILKNECAAVASARQYLHGEIESMRLERARAYELYGRACAAAGLCTPSRQGITGR